MKKKKIIGLSIIVLICTIIFLIPFQIAQASLETKPLTGVTIVLDAGHGGKDDGAKSGDVNEQEINLAITKQLETLLMDAGAKVTLTRDGDYDLADDGSGTRKRRDMTKRVDMINEEEVDLFLSIHLNAYPNNSVKGAQAFYKKGDEASKQFANIIQENLQDLTKTKMVTKTGDYFILNNSDKVGALVECGFISNGEDRSNLIQESYQKKVAETLYESVLEYLDFLG